MSGKSTKSLLPIAVASIAKQFELLTPDEEKVQEACNSIRDLVSHPPTSTDIKSLRKLSGLLRDTDGSTARPVLELFDGLLPMLDRPWPHLVPLLESSYQNMTAKGLDLTLGLIEDGRLDLDRRVLHGVARILEQEDGPLFHATILSRLRDAVNDCYRPGGAAPGEGLDQLFLHDPGPDLRRLAGTLLDLDGGPAPAAVAERMLGKMAWRVLAPYLTYTRANHGDLVSLCGSKRLPRHVVDMFSKATRDHGEASVRAAIATLGWKRVNQGLRLEAFVELTWPGVFPLYVRPEEAKLFATDPPPTSTGPCHLVVAQGEIVAQNDKHAASDDPIDRFRRMNISHAELLGEILEVAPPDKAKILRIIALMDSVVEAFSILFEDLAEEYRILPDVWGRLRNRALAELGETPRGGAVSADLTRLVLAFEDPSNLGEVRTIHGLKRYLHQEGLKRGFDIVETGRSPNRTVDILLLPDHGEPVKGPTIQYAELEAGIEPQPDSWLPQPVRMVVDGLSWQLLRGTTSFPDLNVFIFGNEVHYYIYFRNHPAFLRVDFSPPQRGGMLDLEYFGVSNYEVDIHPNIKLNDIHRFFRAMDLDVQIEGTRLFVRYDKERCHSLADLGDKVASLFRFAPFLMDVDWVVGSLQFPPGIRAAVAGAWAERFRRSGILPIESILTKDRRQILVDRIQGPTGEIEKVWDGKGAYEDRFMGQPPSGLWERVEQEADRLGLDLPVPRAKADGCPLPLLEIHRDVLDPIRRGVESEQLSASNGNLHPANQDLFVLEHEVERMAAILVGEETTAGKAVEMARPLAYLEKFFSFEPTGYVGGLQVEKGRLPLRGGELSVYAGRDQHGVIRMGMYSLHDGLFLRRKSRSGPWRSNSVVDAERLWALMRSANYVGDSPVGGETGIAGTLRDLRSLAECQRPGQGAGLTGDDSVLTGLAAAPGRAVGRALFGTEGRQPEDMIGSVLVAREIRPTDTQYLFKASGVVSTGGAVLSHAALLAIQFGIPAMVVEGHWDDLETVPALRFKVTKYRDRESVVHGLNVCQRTVVSEGSSELVEGDLLVLDANEGVVQVLGQEADTIVLWNGFRLLGKAYEAMEMARAPREILETRAQQLRAGHQIRKAIQRILSPAIASFALEEIMVGDDLAGMSAIDRGEILGDLLANPAVAADVRVRLQETTARLADRYRSASIEYREGTPSARFMFEVLGLRLRCLRWKESLTAAMELQRGCRVDGDATTKMYALPEDDPAITRLGELGRQLKRQLTRGGPEVRHDLRRLGRLDRVLPGKALMDASTRRFAAELAAADAEALSRAADRMILHPQECGLGMHPLLGWKAANLAEIDRLVGPQTVPPWYVLTDTAFRRMLARPMISSPLVKKHLGGGSHTLGAAINKVLGLPRTDHAGKADLIRELWLEVSFPEDLAADIDRAHAGLQGQSTEEIFVALRSSSCDEDSETAMRAGIYDTFLFVRGIKSVLEHIRLTWSGLWTRRALYGREADGDIRKQPAGGLIVQRMVRSRVSGVLQTVNVATGNLRELLISVGLGLGEGIVSGLAAADLITVVKDQGPDRDPVHFNYLTNDKPEQVVFDQHRGRGTRVVETLYHQRLRPAMEYTELCEVTRKAVTLEVAYGYPLDIEFAMEDDRLWLLQARPITTIQAEYQTTLDRYPLRPQTPTGD